MKQQTLLDQDPHTRREGDFYETFRFQTGALLRRVRFSTDWTYVEPCAGNLAIARMFRERGFRMWANDLVQRDAALDSQLDARDPETWRFIARQLGGHIDVAVTNLPFADAFAIAPVAFQHVRRGFATLLRSTWDEPVEDRATKADKDEWLGRHDHLLEQIAMPRAKYRGTASSDSATHHWFIFQREPGLLVPSPLPPGWRTVTRRERDELIGLYGEGR